MASELQITPDAVKERTPRQGRSPCVAAADCSFQTRPNVFLYGKFQLGEALPNARCRGGPLVQSAPAARIGWAYWAPRRSRFAIRRRQQIGLRTPAETCRTRRIIPPRKRSRALPQPV